MAGWIKIHRSLQEHWLWKDEPYDKARAWIDLLLLANYEDAVMIYKGKKIVCKRGDVNFSLSYLAKRWNWSRHKVSDFLDLLEKDRMVEQKRTPERTVISIVNYSIYQTTEDSQKDSKRTANGTKKGHNKEIKENKNVIYSRNKFNQFESQAYDMDAIERSLDL